MNNLEAMRALRGTNMPAFRKSTLEVPRLPSPAGALALTVATTKEDSRRRLFLVTDSAPRSLCQEAGKCGLCENTICSQVSDRK